MENNKEQSYLFLSGFLHRNDKMLTSYVFVNDMTSTAGNNDALKKMMTKQNSKSLNHHLLIEDIIDKC